MAEVSDTLDDLARRVIGAAIEVHKVLGPGFLEAVYEEALGVELDNRGIHFLHQCPICVPSVSHLYLLCISYKGQPVGEGRLDLLVENCLIVELKATETLTPLHQAQIIFYPKTRGRV